MRAFAVLILASCASHANGAGTLLDLQPPRPAMVGAYDFDLLERVRGDACVSKSPDAPAYWLVGEPFDHIPAASRNVVGAAVFHLLDAHPELDSVIATRVLVVAKDETTTCATVYGRGIRLTKLKAAAAPAEPEHGDDDDDDKPADKTPDVPVDPFSNAHGHR